VLHEVVVNAGRLIVFEGIDGAGKSTQLRRLAAALRSAGYRVVETCEPTDGRFGQRIRAMARSGARVAAREELHWFVEDRREHVAAVVQPGVASGAIILSDRYFLSTVAYQGARGLDPTRLLAEAEAEFPLPDLALLLDVDPTRGLERVAARGGTGEPAFENTRDLLDVAAAFRAIDRAYLVRIDGSGTPDLVATQVRTAVHERLGLL
jgi:dTMP kinase